jgi:hypothetical protein
MNIDLSLLVSILNLCLSTFSVFVLVSTIKSYIRSTFGYTLICFLSGAALLEVIQLFVFTSDHGYFTLNDTTVVISWHFVFYIAMIAFVIAGQALVRLVTAANPEDSSAARKSAWLVGLFPAIAILALMFFGKTDNFITAFFKDSWFDRLGGVHFLAFLLALLVAYYFRRVGVLAGSNIAAISVPLLGVLVVLSSVHVWELLTESWHVITVPSEVIELVEQVLAIPAFSLLLFGVLRLRKLMRG